MNVLLKIEMLKKRAVTRLAEGKPWMAQHWTELAKQLEIHQKQ